MGHALQLCLICLLGTVTAVADPIHNAARSGKPGELTRLLRSQASLVNKPNRKEHMWRPLHYAVDARRAGIVRYLISKGARVNEQTLDGYSPLTLAARNGDERTLSLLLQSGAIIQASTATKRTLVHAAAAGGNVKILDLALAKGLPADTADATGKTPLMTATFFNRIELMKALLKKSVKVNARDKLGQTVVHKAAGEGHTDALRLLLANDAKLDVADRDGNTPLHTAAIQGRLEAAKALLKGGAKIDAGNNQKNTPLLSCLGSLQFAERFRGRKHENVALLLINSGANVNAVDLGGHSPVLMAAAADNQKILDALLEKKAKHMPLPNGNTGLHLSSTPAIALALVKQGVQVNARSRSGETALHGAARMGNNDLIIALIKAGADANIADNAGSTPVHAATFKGSIKCLKSLVRGGAKVNTENGKGRSPLWIARRMKYAEVIQFLEEQVQTPK